MTNEELTWERVHELPDEDFKKTVYPKFTKVVELEAVYEVYIGKYYIQLGSSDFQTFKTALCNYISHYLPNRSIKDTDLTVLLDTIMFLDKLKNGQES